MYYKYRKRKKKNVIDLVCKEDIPVLDRSPEELCNV